MRSSAWTVRAVAWGGHDGAIRAAWLRMPEASRELLAFERFTQLAENRREGE